MPGKVPMLVLVYLMLVRSAGCLFCFTSKCNKKRELFCTAMVADTTTCCTEGRYQATLFCKSAVCIRNKTKKITCKINVIPCQW